jgi:hypothetical protein
VETDGRVKLEARHIANDYRPKPETGAGLSDVNPLDGSRPIVARSAVIPILEDAQARGLLRMETRDVRRQHKSGTFYKDREILIDLPDTLNAFVTPIARYLPAEEVKRKRYTFQEPCQSCGEVHARTRKTFCGGCGSEYEADRHLPIVADESSESTSTKNVEVDYEDKDSVPPAAPPTYMGTIFVEADSSVASTKIVNPDAPPEGWVLPYSGQAGRDQWTG